MTYSDQCDKNSVVYVANKTSAPVSLERTTVDIRDIANAKWDYCLNLCKQAAEKCYAFLYSETHCIITAPSETSKYIMYEIGNEAEILTTKTCVAGLLKYNDDC